MFLIHIFSICFIELCPHMTTTENKLFLLAPQYMKLGLINGATWNRNLMKNVPYFLMFLHDWEVYSLTPKIKTEFLHKTNCIKVFLCHRHLEPKINFNEANESLLNLNFLHMVFETGITRLDSQRHFLSNRLITKRHRGQSEHDQGSHTPGRTVFTLSCYRQSTELTAYGLCGLKVTVIHQWVLSQTLHKIN